jgi:poly-gamma-glutamate synthesis protein (capsule biosynthesis protein)
LKRAGLKTSGAGRDIEHARAPVVFDLGETGRVIVFSLASVTSGVPPAWAATRARPGINLITDFSSKTVEKIAGQVRALKRPRDIAVMSIHWGGNWGYDVPVDQRQFARQLIKNAEIDVIHGHSSHHPRGIEVFMNRPIIYGCGDFINDYEGIGGRERYRGDLTLMYFLDIDPVDGNLLGFEMVPHQVRNFRLNRPSKNDSAWLNNTLHRECQKLNSRVDLTGDGLLVLRW